MKKENIKVVEEIEEVKAEQETAEQAVDVSAQAEQESEVTIEIIKKADSKLDKLKKFGKKHWKAIAGAAAVGTAAVLVAKATKKDDVIEGEFEEVIEPWNYAEGYEQREEVKEETETEKVEEGA